MKRRYVMVGLASIATLAIVSPVLAGESLSSLVRKEVAKQLSVAQSAKKAKRGRRGPAGPAGANGTNGANGTARAYAYVDYAGCHGATPFTCDLDPRSKGVTSVNQTAPSSGIYCATVPGLSPATTPVIASVETGASIPGNGTNAVVWNALNFNCPAPQYEFQTYVGATLSGATSFTFVIP